MILNVYRLPCFVRAHREPVRRLVLSKMSARNLGNSTSKSSSPLPAMFSVLSSAQLLSFLLATLGPGRLHQYLRYWIESIFEVLD